MNTADTIQRWGGRMNQSVHQSFSAFDVGSGRRSQSQNLRASAQGDQRPRRVRRAVLTSSPPSSPLVPSPKEGRGQCEPSGGKPSPPRGPLTTSAACTHARATPLLHRGKKCYILLLLRLYPGVPGITGPDGLKHWALAVEYLQDAVKVLGPERKLLLTD